METTLVDPAAARQPPPPGQNPRTAEILELYRCLAPALITASACIQPIRLPAAVIEEKLNSGVPLLVGEEWSIDPQDCREIFLSITRAVRRDIQSRGEYLPHGPDPCVLHLDRIIANIENDNLYPLALLSAFNQDRSSLIEETAFRLGHEPRLLHLLAKNTFKAYLHAWRSGLQTQVNLANWQRGACPFCGTDPGLAEVQGVERARYLRCLQCGARWPYPNLKCAFCGNNDHHSLGILQLDGETHKYYVHTCDRCKRYIKTIATFDPLSTERLLAEDLATLHLDAIAMEKGYK